MLMVEGVTKRYGSGATEVTAVRDVSLTVMPGEIVLIMGPSGSGKTTLLSMLGALLKPTEGTIRLNGQVISALAENRLPDIRLRQFGFVFQDFNLLSALTALENVALVAQLAGKKKGQARKRAAALLADLGLAERLNFLPEELSGGEKQRVAIARALVNDPALILADEPTANLDSKIGHEIMRLLRRIAKERPGTGGRAGGRSVVIVSHDERIKDIADRVLWLEDGQFKEMVTTVAPRRGHYLRRLGGQRGLRPALPRSGRAGVAPDSMCGMVVEREKAAARLEVGGATYYFCSKGCRAEFLANHRDLLGDAGAADSYAALGA